MHTANPGANQLRTALGLEMTKFSYYVSRNPKTFNEALKGKKPQRCRSGSNH